MTHCILFIGIIPRQVIGYMEMSATRGLLAGLESCLLTGAGGTGICQPAFPWALISAAVSQTSGSHQDVESEFFNMYPAWSLSSLSGNVFLDDTKGKIQNMTVRAQGSQTGHEGKLKFWRQGRGNLSIQAFRYLDIYIPRSKWPRHSPDSSRESTQSLLFLLSHMLAKNIFVPLPMGQVGICLSSVRVFAHLLTQILIQACLPTTGSLRRAHPIHEYYAPFLGTFSEPFTCTLPPATDSVGFTCVHEGQLRFGRSYKWAFFFFPSHYQPDVHLGECAQPVWAGVCLRFPSLSSPHNVPTAPSKMFFLI